MNDPTRESKDSTGESPAYGTKRRSIWAIIPREDGIRPGVGFVPRKAPADLPPVTQSAESQKPQRKKRSFYIHLTSWQGTALCIRCTTGSIFPMQAVQAGGTYLIYGNRMLYVRESQSQINARIYWRLRQLQNARVA